MISHYVKKFKREYNIDLTSDKLALNKLRNACEQAKCKLSFCPQASIEIGSLYEGINFCTYINHGKFEELNVDFFCGIMNAVKDSLEEAKMEREQINYIILVGGSTQIPMLQLLLQDFFSGKELNKSMDSKMAVAYRAAVHAAILAGFMPEEFRHLVVLDVYPLSLCIGRVGKETVVIINQNTTIPTTKTVTHNMEEDNQEKCRSKCTS
jgi:L1 cell adhesion molecule like protein